MRIEPPYRRVRGVSGSICVDKGVVFILKFKRGVDPPLFQSVRGEKMNRYCEKCGKPLEENEVCGCETAEEKEKRNYSAESKEAFQKVQGAAKNVFAEILPTLRAPFSHSRKMMESGSGILGFSMIGLKAIIVFLVGAMLLLELKAQRYVVFNLSIGEWLLICILLVFAMDCLYAFLWKGVLRVFGDNIPLHKPVIATGSFALFEGFGYGAGYILIQISDLLGVLCMLAGGSFGIILMYLLMDDVSSLSKDRKIMAFTVTRLVYTVIVCFVLAKFVLPSISYNLNSLF